jgi:hypothetical protein
MGANYEAKIRLTDAEDGPAVTLHIGKASAGWCFALHVHPEHGINTLADWQEIWRRPNVTITDEYGHAVEPGMMLDEVIARSWSGHRVKLPYRDEAAWFRVNQAAPGPNGLARAVHNAALPPDPARDTYDLVTGDFS